MPLLALSYRRQDSDAITGRIFDRLALHYGRDAVFRDIDSIPAGIDFREHINGFLEKCDLLIVIIGRRWLGRSRANAHRRIDDPLDFVRIEVETALHLDIPVIPILVGNAQMPAASELPDSISQLAFRNALRVDAGQDFEHHISRLLRSIDQSARSKESVPSNQEGGTHPSRPASTRKGTSLSTRWAIGVLIVGILLIISFSIALLLQKRNFLTTTLAPSHEADARLANTSSDELLVLLRGSKIEPLKNFLRAHPHEPRAQEILHRISSITRSEFSEWTVYGVPVNDKPLVYFQYNSIEKIGGTKYALRRKITLDPNIPVAGVANIPEGSQAIFEDVYDCQAPRYWNSEATYYDKNQKIFHHYKWGDPKYVDAIVDPQEIRNGSIASTARAIVCTDEFRSPLLSKQELTEFKFVDFASTTKGDGELYYQSNFAKHQAILIAKLDADKQFAEIYPDNKTAFGSMSYRSIVDLIDFDCDHEKVYTIKTEYYSAGDNLEFVRVSDPSTPRAWNEINKKSPMELLSRIICGGS